MFNNNHMIYLLLISEIILIILAIFLSIQFFNILFRSYAPFISTNKKIIEKILLEIKLNDNNKVIELGCGKAGFLRALAKKFPNTKLIGIEYSFLPWIIAKIQSNFGRYHNIKIIRENIFKTDISEANLIYCYLNIKMMRDLENKFKKECKKGTQIISYLFKLPNLKPSKIIENNHNKIYFYTI